VLGDSTMGATPLASTHQVQPEATHHKVRIPEASHTAQVHMGHMDHLPATLDTVDQCLMHNRDISTPQDPHMASTLHLGQDNMDSTDRDKGHLRDSTQDMIPAAILVISHPHHQAPLFHTKVTINWKMFVNCVNNSMN